jgi:hypothetical protein
MHGTCAAFSGGFWVLGLNRSFGQVGICLWEPKILSVDLVVTISYSLVQPSSKILLKVFRIELLVTKGDFCTCLENKFSGEISG